MKEYELLFMSLSYYNTCLVSTSLSGEAFLHFVRKSLTAVVAALTLVVPKGRHTTLEEQHYMVLFVLS